MRSHIARLALIMREVVAAPDDDTDQALSPLRMALYAQTAAFIPRTPTVQGEVAGATVEGISPRAYVVCAAVWFPPEPLGSGIGALWHCGTACCAEAGASECASRKGPHGVHRVTPEHKER